MKRLAAALIILVFLALPLPAAADLVLSAPESADPGRRFTVSLHLEGEDDLSAVHIDLTYEEPLTLADVKESQPCKLRYKEKDGGAELILLSKSTFSPGEAAVLTFSLKSASGSVAINAKVTRALNEKLEDVSLKCVGCTVEINEKADSHTGSQTGSSSARQSDTKVRSSSGGARASSAKGSGAQSKRVSSKSSSKKTSASSSKGSSKASSESTPQEVSASYRETTGRVVGNEDSPLKYAAAGSAMTVAVLLILFAVYRMGQLSRDPKGSYDKEK